jgi:hypothetical protein
MKKTLVLLVMVALLAGVSMAMELGGKTGFGLRAGSFSVRRFINNSCAVELGGYYANASKTGQADSNQISAFLSGFYAKEIYPNTLLEIGAAIQNDQGNEAGVFFNSLSLNPFIGGEVFINDHVALDGKLFIGAYSSAMSPGNVRTTSFDALTGNLGAHIYL